MFSIRPLKDEDYFLLNEWWKFWKFPPPPKDYLPQEGKGGIMLEKEGVPICAGFIFFTNSKMAWIEYIVSSSTYRGSDRKEALNHLIECISEIIENKGFKIVFTSVKNENLINRFSESGFIKTSKNTTEMIKVL